MPLSEASVVEKWKMDIFGSSYRCSPVRTARAFRLGAPHQSRRLGGTTALLRLLKSWCRSRRTRFAKPKRLPRRTRDGLQCTDIGKLSQIGLRSAHGCAMMRYSVRPTAVWKKIPAPKGEDLELETQVQIAVPPRTLLVGERAGALAAGPSSRPRRARTGPRALCGDRRQGSLRQTTRNEHSFRPPAKV